jgi:hypothetical protein
MAAEGRLMANDVRRDRTKATFVRGQARTLGEEAQHEAEKLADATPDRGLDLPRRQAVVLAGRLSDELSELQTWPGREDVGRKSAERLGDLVDEIDDLDHRL